MNPINVKRADGAMSHHTYCSRCHRLLIGTSEIGCNYCCNCGAPMEDWDEKQKKFFIKEQAQFCDLFEFDNTVYAEAKKDDKTVYVYGKALDSHWEIKKIYFAEGYPPSYGVECPKCKKGRKYFNLEDAKADARDVKNIYCKVCGERNIFYND